MLCPFACVCVSWFENVVVCFVCGVLCDAVWVVCVLIVVWFVVVGVCVCCLNVLVCLGCGFLCVVVWCVLVLCVFVLFVCASVVYACACVLCL